MKNIAIIGAGISGLYIANLFSQNSNYKITIYEKNSSVNLEKGYGIQLSVNSIKLLNQINFQKISVEIVPFNLENLIIIFIFIFDILKFKAFTELSGLGICFIGNICKFFKKFNLVFFISKNLLFFL